ncbi:MAG: DNA repair protein RecN, partial [Oscillospiraceae bacterium]|nr:DNA repair protein RecN [Oscillospiraceae bacterium]
CGRPVTASVLRELGSLLINIHGQHDNQILLRAEKHIDILDAFGETEPVLAVYQESYRKLLKVHRELVAIDTDQAEKERKIDLLTYQIQEITAANLKENEDEQLENDKKALLNYTSILEQLQSAYSALFGDDREDGATLQVSDAANSLASAAEYDGGLAEISERLTDLSYQLEDIAQEVSAELQDMDYDPGQLDQIEERLDLIHKLKRKYGETIADIQAFLENAQKELETITLSEEQIEILREAEQNALQETRQQAQKLTLFRKAAAERFVQKITEELQFLDMPNVRLTVNFSEGKLRAGGRDEVEFFISTNPGEPPKPLSKIASGGELSRIMLAIKNVLADRDEVPTLIFDEVDTGISGRAAQKVGLKLKEAAKHRQIICVTHLAQIAALADTHFLIEKIFDQEKTFTRVHSLDFEGRKREIARIIGTDQITELTLKNAEEMLTQGR